MKYLAIVLLAYFATIVKSSGLVDVYGDLDDGQWHGEGLLESQDPESFRFALVAPAVVAARAFPVHHPVVSAPALPLPPPVAPAAPLPPVVPAPVVPPVASVVPFPPVAFRVQDDGQWHGEGLLESQDLEAHRVPLLRAAVHPPVPAFPVHPPVAPVLAYSVQDDGQWHGEGLLESQDLESRGIYRW